jgi:hypothetical protein
MDELGFGLFVAAPAAELIWMRLLGAAGSVAASGGRSAVGAAEALLVASAEYFPPKGAVGWSRPVELGREVASKS